jgi:hypothetical protein
MINEEGNVGIVSFVGHLFGGVAGYQQVTRKKNGSNSGL